jgi:hypothetical protein
MFHNILFYVIFAFTVSLCYLRFDIRCQGKSFSQISAGNVNMSLWNVILNEHTYSGVKNGISSTLVNYTAIANSNNFLEFGLQLATANTTGFNHTEFYAFWINVYNYLAIKLVIENPCRKDMFGSCLPLESIRNIGEEQPSEIVTVWDYEISNAPIGGKIYTLNQVETMLRNPPNNIPKDPRIHACIVCASVSCPDLRNEAYVASEHTLYDQMSNQMNTFLRNVRKGLDPNNLVNGILILSPIFQWFASDFGNSTAAVLQWSTFIVYLEVLSYQSIISSDRESN